MRSFNVYEIYVMATNKNALIRYRTIDKCLQNRQRKWTLDDLINACSDALYEFEGKESNVSKRTVQLDLQFMRSDKLGYNAPIVVFERKFYTYEDPNYTITDIPLTDTDLDILSESMEMLRQFKDFSLFSELNGVIQKLEDKIYRESQDQNPIIHIEKNELLKGLQHLDVIYQAILKKIVININYKSFSARTAGSFIFHPFILKEFNNRWFVIGKKSKNSPIMTLALDRILEINLELSIPVIKHHFNANEYYNNTIGVTVMKEKDIITIIMKVDSTNTPYVETKPFHHSQRLIEKSKKGEGIFELTVSHNFELERLILGFGETIEIIEPRRLRQRIKKKLERAYLQYQN